MYDITRFPNSQDPIVSQRGRAARRDAEARGSAGLGKLVRRDFSSACQLLALKEKLDESGNPMQPNTQLKRPDRDHEERTYVAGQQEHT